MKLLAVLPVIALVLTGCDRSDPPAVKMERAAEELVKEVEGENLPQQAAGPFAPRDECTDQPGAAEFLSQLRRAIRDRDAESVAALAAEDVRLTVLDDAGRARFVELLDASGGERWSALDDLLELGCASDGATMTMPYFAAQEIAGEWMETAIVTGEDIPVYEAPDASSPDIARLSWEAVRRVDNTSDGMAAVTWSEEGTGRPREGFIRSENLRLLADYELGVSRRNDRWRITHFVQGD
ncbi:hypothetical protein [Aurantiacibacter aquimixticola]|uniref:Lipoprotein n=1 Tax=Aurantiacibacter aquimixticola TaxID=1958945 RepID=A0A419RQZ6_9SPHN|nr:hypothetical protein [Aurantiacibacter aquimixticola]RJY08196.1 hypothetical protein D6201_01435 [Aurantiacibacter aquimixticola]